MTAHAKLSPSSSERWITCPGSVRLIERSGVVGETSRFAEEGTLAHELAEMTAAQLLGIRTREDFAARYPRWEERWRALNVEHHDLQEVQKHAADYAELVRAFHRQYGGAVMLERRVDTGIQRCWGTGDAIIVSATHVEVIDLKYGAGVPVAAQENTQLMLYGVGALHTYGDLLGDVETVGMTIFQPRIDQPGGETYSRFEMRASDLLLWRDEIVRPQAIKALSKIDAELRPSAKACRWCPVAGVCKARMEWETRGDFEGDPELMSPEELGELLYRLPSIRAWADSVERAAFTLEYESGVDVPGWKVVQGSGRRQIAEHAAAIQVLIDEGFRAEDISDIKTKGIGTLERIVGKQRLPEVLGDLLVRREGGPQLVRDSDSREAIDVNLAARGDFG